ncbi:hypothetical protein [Polaromonas sp.]|uniref:hypothetical protein n=1 Tax=Polaromonas sp. TaxID=1869339 RepID=UPI00352A0137
MASDVLFGGTPLLPAHFDSDVAKAVFNDKGRAPIGGGFQVAVENRLLDWLSLASPKLIMRWSHQIDVLIVPILSPSGFRALCSYLCEHLPQAIENMPNTRESVTSLARAVHLSKFINPAALDRLSDALKQEGLAKN